MGYIFLFGFILPLLILSALFQKGFCDDDEDDVKFVAWFSDDVTDCTDFENEMICADLAMGPIESNGSMTMGFSGKLIIKKKIEEGMMVSIDLSKIESMSKNELLFVMNMEFCSSLKEDDAPWTATFEQLGITSCPILEGEILVEDLVLDITFMERHLKSENKGSYQLKMKLMNSMKEDMSCHLFDVDIDEKTK